MNAFIPFTFVGAVVAIVACGLVLVKRRAFTWWDRALLIGPFALWWALAIVNLRVKSLANLSEPLALLPLLALIMSSRTFGHVPHEESGRARLAFLSGLAVATLLYFLVPTLPE